VTTLGRGGSDLSAAVLGRALGAASIKLYKVEHVNGADGLMEQWVAGWEGVVHDADTRTTIPRLHYEEARELAHFAKKVLHPDTVAPAVDAAIPISVLNTLDARHPGTRISGAAAGAGAGADGGGAAARVSTVTGQPLAAYEAVHAKAGHGVAATALAALRLTSRDDAALVALVGFGIMRMDNVAARALAALAAGGVPAVMPEYVNGSQHSLSILVPLARRKDALQLLHKTFITDATPGQAA
jgi:aspartokinase